MKKTKITREPYVPPGEYYASITEEVTGKLLWQGGPYPDSRSAERAAGRQASRFESRTFPDRREYV